jgi:pantothenate kinase
MAMLIDYAERFVIDHRHGSWRHQLGPNNRSARTLLDGKPDLYHALQASLLTELPLGSSMAARLIEGKAQSPTASSVAQAVTVTELIERIEQLALGRDRVVIGLVGPPGAGKSTLAAALVGRLGARAALLGMDGFHLGQRELERLGRADRKGAPDTFDVLGYLELLRRIRSRPEVDHFVPVFDRHLDEPIAANGCVPAGVPIVITEGNYLLLQDNAWREVVDQLDESWFIEPDDTRRLDRLTRRHVDHGRTPAQAAEWVARVDEANTRRIVGGAARADLSLSDWTDEDSP